MIEIDGSFGEGGGQILRSSLALSLITQTPFRISNIRRNRSKPGLRRQHLTAVRAAAKIGQAELAGDELSSSELTFQPKAVRGGEFHFDIGSAGSTTLVFQTVLPALLLAAEPSVLEFTGGTHNHGGPPWDFLSRVFVPTIAKMGAQVEIALQRHGFAPGGLGRWSARIQPSKLRPIALHDRGELYAQSVRALVSNLPPNVAERELKVAREQLRWPREAFCAETVEAAGPGNILLIEGEFQHAAELATGFGRRGVLAETVAMEAVNCWRAFESANVPVGEHLADQLLLPIALAGSGSFSTMKPTLHTITNAETIARFLPVEFQIENPAATVWRISLL